jgi:CubicO group peptidase (beta-lactamase class C family)
MTTTRDVDRSGPAVAEPDLRRTIAKTLRRWPSAGLAVAVVRDGSPPRFLGHGVADTASERPVSEHTVFRVASLTKVLTAVAVMQLCEQRLSPPVADAGGVRQQMAHRDLPEVGPRRHQPEGPQGSQRPARRGRPGPAVGTSEAAG